MENNQEQNQDQNEPIEIDSWEKAFAAIDQREEETTKEVSTSKPDSNNASDTVTETSDEDTNAFSNVEDNSNGTEGELGDDSSILGTNGTEDQSDTENYQIDEHFIDEYKASLDEEIKDQVVKDVAEAYIKEGVRNNNGKLGATIRDKDICKYDDDKVPHFYNPETGREFSGDNPRKQAQEWVDAYNKELAEVFNKTCSEYYDTIADSKTGSLKVLEFESKYNSLDPIRKSMFDSIIEDYEVKDSDGDVVSYSCNLDRALEAVNRQVRVIQSSFGSKSESKPAGPAIDMPNTGKTHKVKKEHPEFKSVAEALEWEQDQLLEKQKKGKH